MNTHTTSEPPQEQCLQSCLIELGSETELAVFLSSSSLKDKLPTELSPNRKFWIYESADGPTFHITICHEIGSQEYRFRRSNGPAMTELEFEICEEADDFLTFMQDQDYAFIDSMAAAVDHGASSSELVAAFKFYSEKMHCDIDRLVDLARENSAQLYSAVRSLDV